MNKYEKIIKDYEKRSRQEHKIAREVVARIEDIPDTLLLLLLKDKNRDVRYAALENPKAPKSIINKNLKSKHFEYKLRIAKNPSLDIDQYKKLLKTVSNENWSRARFVYNKNYTYVLDIEKLYCNLINNENSPRNIKNAATLQAFVVGVLKFL